MNINVFILTHFRHSHPGLFDANLNGVFSVDLDMNGILDMLLPPTGTVVTGVEDNLLVCSPAMRSLWQF